MDKLDLIFDRQKALDDFIAQNHSEQAKNMTLVTTTLAMLVETVETLEELPWKPWKQNKQVDKEKLFMELADVLHFFISLCIKLGISPNLLFNLYCRKNFENWKRQMGKVSGREDYVGKFYNDDYYKIGGS
ncbi:MAG: hypothetical protein PWQ67_2514 [Clostridia bacterium]|nr:hypothetical protein [Clostridia bacterium]